MVLKQKSIIVIAMTERGVGGGQQRSLWIWDMERRRKQFTRYVQICWSDESHRCVRQTFEKILQAPGFHIHNKVTAHGHSPRDIHDLNQNRYFTEVRE